VVAKLPTQYFRYKVIGCQTSMYVPQPSVDTGYTLYRVRTCVAAFTYEPTYVMRTLASISVG